MKFDYFQQPTRYDLFAHDFNSTLVSFLYDSDKEGTLVGQCYCFTINALLKVIIDNFIRFILFNAVGRQNSSALMENIRNYVHIVLFSMSAITIAFGALSLAKFIREENNFRIRIGPVALDLTAICRIIWTLAFLLNLVTVSLPGRFDTISADEAQKKRLEAVSKDDVKQIEVTMPWKTLFEPSPWAFAIWGIIYLTELLLTVFVSCLGNVQRPAIESATAYWVAGTAFQSRWCFCFRPEYRHVLWLPMVFLALASGSFFTAHHEITLLIGSSSASLSLLQRIGLYLFRFPFSLHASM